MLREQVAGLRSKVEAANNRASDDASRRELERLLREQHDLQESVQRMSRRLLRLTAEGAARLTASAADQLGPAGPSGAESPASGAGQQIEAAERDLEQAQAELAQTLRQADADLASEQLADMTTTIQSLTNRQHRIVEETERLDTAHKSQREWTFGQLQSLAGLAEEERLLDEETRGLAERLVELDIVRGALEIAAQDMARASAWLTQRDAGELTQLAARTAHRRLTLVLEALAAEEEDGGAAASGQDAASGAGAGQGGQGDDEESTIDVAELRLLKLMQSDLSQRTVAAEAALAAENGDNAAAERQFSQLAQEQGQIATLFQQLLNESTQAQNDPGADLPDLDAELEKDDPLPDLDF
jgi:hypothetical protein